MRRFPCLLLLLAAALTAGAAERTIRLQPFGGADTASAAALDSWSTQRYWGGTLGREQGALTLTATETAGGPRGRVLSPVANANLSGARLRVSLRVRGRGSFRCGAIRYPAGKTAPTDDDYRWGDAVELGEAWREYRTEFDFGADMLRSVNVLLEVSGADGKAWIDDLKLGVVPDDTVKISGPPARFLRGAEETPDLKFQTDRPGAFFRSFVTYADRRQPLAFGRYPADAGGVVTVPGRDIPMREGTGVRITLGLEGNGMLPRSASGCASCAEAEAPETFQATTALSRIPEDAWERCAKTAAAVRLAGPLRLLVLADSIWDFDRGYNTADRLAFFLNQAHPGQVSVANYAVHGDRIDRMLARFQGDLANVAHGRDRYRALPRENPTMILVMLGHNDTMVTSRTGFQQPAVPPAVQERDYRALIAGLRRRWPAAEIVLLTPLAVDYDTIFTRTEAQAKAGGTAFRYGAPEPVNAFCATLRKVAAADSVRLCNIHAPMSEIKEKSPLFRPDGVHLSLRGHDLLAELVLRDLAAHCNGKDQP